MSLKSPNAAIERGAYSAIVYMDGDLCVAEDSVGTVISEQVKSTNVSDVIQEAADNISGVGSIFVKNIDEDYIIKSGVSWDGGISFVSDGARLDLKTLNSTFLTIGSDSYDCDQQRTEISGFCIEGEYTNANTLFLKASRINRGLVISDLVHLEVKNMIEVRGKSYCSRIERVVGSYTGGSWIKLVSLASFGEAPNATVISQCENSNGYYEDNLGIGVEILASAGMAPLPVTIRDCHIENMATGIYSEADLTYIINNYIAAKDYCVHLHEHATYAAAARSIIQGNEFWQVDSSTGIGIGLLGQSWLKHVIAGNIFRTIQGTGILNGKSNYCTIANNQITLDLAATVGIGQTGTDYMQMSNIIGNQFYGAATPRGTAIAAYITLSAIQGNTFDGVTYWLNHANILNSIIHGNVLSNVTNDSPTVGSGNIISGNSGYYTEKDGTSTGTGAQQTVAHGLSTTPTIVMVGDIEQASNPYQSAAADGTNIYVTAGNGLDWWWKAEV